MLQASLASDLFAAPHQSTHSTKPFQTTFHSTDFLANVRNKTLNHSHVHPSQQTTKQLPLSQSPTFEDNSPPLNFFHVDQQGIFRAIAVIDREIHHSFHFKVLAIDHGTPVLTATTYVHITVLDQNDERPHFDNDSYSFTLSEDKPVGVFVGSVRATDLDGPGNNRILHSFEIGLFDLDKAIPRNVSSDNHFSIDCITGALYLLEPLDREKVSVHRFTVVAFDPTNSSMRTETLVIVVVLDVNDNPPTFVFPSPNNFSATLHLTSKPSTPHFVTRIVATDVDEGNNAVVLYDLVWVRRLTGRSFEKGWHLENDSLNISTFGNSNGSLNHVLKQLSNIDYSQHFHVDHKSGTILMTSQPPSVSATQSSNQSSVGGHTKREEAYELTVMIKDSAEPTFSSTSRLLVVLKNDRPNASLSYTSPYLFNLNRSMHILIISLLLIFSTFVCVSLVITTVCLLKKRKKMSSLATVATIGCDGNIFGFENEKQIDEKFSELSSKAKTQKHATTGSHSIQLCSVASSSFSNKYSDFSGLSLLPTLTPSSPPQVVLS